MLNECRLTYLLRRQRWTKSNKHSTFLLIAQKLKNSMCIFSIYLMLYEIENECLSALCQMRNKLPELFNPTVSKMDLFLRQKVDLGHQSIV